MPAERIGYQAAVLLDRLLAGAKPPDRPVLLPPTGVAIRQSSDILAIDDPEVAAAARLIHQHGHKPIRVSDLLNEVSISRPVTGAEVPCDLQPIALRGDPPRPPRARRDMLASTELSMSRSPSMRATPTPDTFPSPSDTRWGEHLQPIAASSGVTLEWILFVFLKSTHDIL